MKTLSCWFVSFFRHRWLHSFWFTNKFLGKCHKSLHDLAVSKTHRNIGWKEEKRKEIKRDKGIFAKNCFKWKFTFNMSSIYFFSLSLSFSPKNWPKLPSNTQWSMTRLDWMKCFSRFDCFRIHLDVYLAYKRSTIDVYIYMVCVWIDLAGKWERERVTNKQKKRPTQYSNWLQSYIKLLKGTLSHNAI